jgi:undecaprenyl-diphosphatase
MLERILQWDRETFVYLNSLGIEQYDFFWSTVTKYPHGYLYSSFSSHFFL